MTDDGVVDFEELEWVIVTDERVLDFELDSVVSVHSVVTMVSMVVTCVEIFGEEELQ